MLPDNSRLREKIAKLTADVSSSTGKAFATSKAPKAPPAQRPAAVAKPQWNSTRAPLADKVANVKPALPGLMKMKAYDAKRRAAPSMDERRMSASSDPDWDPPSDLVRALCSRV